MSRDVLPGRRLTLGLSLTYMGLIVLIPLSTIVIKASSLSVAELWRAIAAPRAVASYGLSLGASLAAAAVNLVFGTVIAWVLVRYRFPGRRALDALVDLPFALPTAVAGIALTAAFAPTGVLGEALAKVGIQGAYSRVGVVIALVFVSMPFTVRTVQPVLQAMDPEVETAAATLGASPWQSFAWVVLPGLRPALITGFALSFARSLGEYGSVVFISGNMPMKTEITPLLIMTKLEQFDHAGAAALAVVMLTASFAILVGLNAYMWRTSRSEAPDTIAGAAGRYK